MDHGYLFLLKDNNIEALIFSSKYEKKLLSSILKYAIIFFICLKDF